jgi:hypothetical protein
VYPHLEDFIRDKNKVSDTVFTIETINSIYTKLTNGTFNKKDHILITINRNFTAVYSGETQ